MASAIQPPLIFTFFIYVHGSVRNFELSIKENKIFERCRLFSETAHNLSSTCSEPNQTYMKEKMRKNIFGPMYYFFTKGDTLIKPMASITFDKILGAEPGERDGFLGNALGIYLLSVHRKTSSGLNVFYDLPYWNLLKMDDLHEFAKHFGRDFERLGSEHIEMPTNRTGFIIWSGIELDLKSENIVRIKMSKFVELIKSIVGENVYFNLLDYSCSNDRTETKAYKWNTEIADVENMQGVEVWGGMDMGGMDMGGMKRAQRMKPVKRGLNRNTAKNRKSKRHRRKKISTRHRK